jgi:hypothetical protein
MLRLVLVAALATTFPIGVDRAAQDSGLDVALKGLAARTQQYYDRFISIICTETVRQQELRYNLSPIGKPRVTVYELSVAPDPSATGEAEFRVGRTLQSINGRPAQKNQEPGCTDPKTGSPEPLGFLLANNQPRYKFSARADTAGGPPGAHVIHYVQTPPDRLTITWKGYCFNAEGGGQEGRVWFDPLTYDVLLVEVRLSKPFLVPPPARSIGPHAAVRVERSEAMLRFSRVEFHNPEETVLLPESIETLNVFRGVPSLRIHQTLSNFRRFLTESKIRNSAL